MNTVTQKNCPYCQPGHKPIYEQDNSARMVHINLKGNAKHPYRLCFSYKDKLQKDDYESGGWVIKNPIEHYYLPINYCPMCGRPLNEEN